MGVLNWRPKTKLMMNNKGHRVFMSRNYRFDKLPLENLLSCFSIKAFSKRHATAVLLQRRGISTKFETTHFGRLNYGSAPLLSTAVAVADLGEGPALTPRLSSRSGSVTE